MNYYANTAPLSAQMRRGVRIKIYATGPVRWGREPAPPPSPRDPA